MDVPTGNFFQVTINSQKLFSFMQDIMAQVKVQQGRLQSLSSSVHGRISKMEEQHRNQAGSVDIQLEKIRKGMQEEVNYMRLFMRDVDKKANQKLIELQNTVMLLKDIQEKTKAQLEEDMALKYSYLDKKNMDTNNLLEEFQSNSKVQFSTLQTKTSTLQQQLLVLSSTHQQEVRKNKQNITSLMERLNQTQLDIKNQNEQFASLRNSFVCDSRRNIKSRNKKVQQKQCFDNIMNRMEQVQNKLISQENINSNHSNAAIYSPRKSIFSNNKVVKSGTNLKSGFYDGKKENSKSKFNSFQEAVLDKLNKIQKANSERLEAFERDIHKFGNKAEIVDEHIGILSRKLQKEKNKLNETVQQVKNFEDKRIDDRVIENLRNVIKKMGKDLQESIELKVDKEQYEKQKVRWAQKLHFLHENISDKAEKGDLKKGLTFLQQKIKDVILVLAQQRGMLQESAIKKTPAKCLTCDKEVQGQKETTRAKQAVIRGNTQQMRKRIRMINNTTSTNQYDD